MEPILKDLCVLIRKTTLHYRETCPQGDTILSESFQERLGKYLRDKDNVVDFYKYTAVINTTAGNTMYIPNQWFVVAAYALGVYTELITYKDYLKKVCEYMGQRPKILIPKLRDETASIDRGFFVEACGYVFNSYDKDAISLATSRLWRFATDYSWWSGNKTIDRTDFHLSVIYNMLNIVAVSQSYIGDTVANYYDAGLAPILADLSSFTENQSGKTYEIEDYRDPRDTAPIIERSDNINTIDVGDEIIISVRSRE